MDIYLQNLQRAYNIINTSKVRQNCVSMATASPWRRAGRHRQVTGNNRVAMVPTRTANCLDIIDIIFIHIDAVLIRQIFILKCLLLQKMIGTKLALNLKFLHWCWHIQRNRSMPSIQLKAEISYVCFNLQELSLCTTDQNLLTSIYLIVDG